MLQRDIFIKEITKKLESDKSIYFLSADFGAAALDELREKFPKNFIFIIYFTIFSFSDVIFFL